MTVIVACVDTGRLVMGCDMQTTLPTGDKSLLSSPKIIQQDGLLIGVMGNSALITALSSGIPGLSVPQVIDINWVTQEFLPRLKKLFRAFGCLRTVDGVLSIPDDGALLLGKWPRIFTVYSNFFVSEVADLFTAIGSGAAYAQGAMAFAMQNAINLQATDLVDQAVRIASKYNAHCSGIFIAEQVHADA